MAAASWPVHAANKLEGKPDRNGGALKSAVKPDGMGWLRYLSRDNIKGTITSRVINSTAAPYYGVVQFLRIGSESVYTSVPCEPATRGRPLFLLLLLSSFFDTSWREAIDKALGATGVDRLGAAVKIIFVSTVAQSGLGVVSNVRRLTKAGGACADDRSR